MPHRIRYSIITFLASAFSILFLLQQPKLPHPDHPVVLAIGHKSSSLHRLTIKALRCATHSITGRMYACNDPYVLQELRRCSARHVHVLLEHDATSTPPNSFLTPPIHHLIAPKQGLMHQKLICIDDAYVWIGSANWTTSSLRLHDNLLIGLYCPDLITTLQAQHLHSHFMAGTQRFEFWTLPEQNTVCLYRLLEVLRDAKSSIRVAMFALTHPRLVQALIQAHRKGVSVEVVLDAKMTHHVNAKAYHLLQEAGVPVFLSTDSTTLHHKLVWVDDLLIEGSANWTKAAFSHNTECFIILHDLTPQQIRTLKRFWKTIT